MSRSPLPPIFCFIPRADNRWAALRREVDDAERFEIFDDWEVPRSDKRRKEALFAKIWANEVTKVSIGFCVNDSKRCRLVRSTPLSVS